MHNTLAYLHRAWLKSDQAIFMPSSLPAVVACFSRLAYSINSGILSTPHSGVAQSHPNN